VRREASKCFCLAINQQDFEHTERNHNII